MKTPAADALQHFAERVLSSPEIGSSEYLRAPYRLMAPEGLVAGERYPLVIFLHGAGERGDDNLSHLLYLPEILARPENRRRYPCFALAVQCPADDKWVDVDWGDLNDLPPAGPTRALELMRTIAAAVVDEQPVDPQRIYLTGMSMGGFGSWSLATDEPEAFAALAVLCGGGDVRRASRLKNLPIWAVHGEFDDAVPVEHSRRMIEAVRTVGSRPKYTELSGVGHDCWTTAYAPEFGLLDWMFAQRRA